jgi:hypothetical protein
MYQRDEVYPILGFDDFISMEEMDHDAKLGDSHLISDQAAFAETLGTIEQHDEPVFVNLVTMQNHAPYAGVYDDPVDVAGVGDDATLGQYARGLSHTDQAIADFIAAVEESEEKTVVVLYGDHLPGGIAEEVFMRTRPRVLHETPFFLYANFGDVQREWLGTTSPIYFMGHVLDLAEAPLSPYLTLLRELEQHVPAMEHRRWFGPDGRTITPEELTAEGRQVLRDYRLVQYDLSVGQRYAEQMLYARPGGQVVASPPKAGVDSGPAQ